MIFVGKVRAKTSYQTLKKSKGELLDEMTSHWEEHDLLIVEGTEMIVRFVDYFPDSGNVLTSLGEGYIEYPLEKVIKNHSLEQRVLKSRRGYFGQIKNLR